MTITCPNPDCGIELHTSDTNCPKCDSEVRCVYVNGLYPIDIAHSGENWEDAQEKIDRALDRALLHLHKGLTVIHGHGQETGHSSVIRTRTVPYLKGLAKQHHYKLASDNNNSGAHILYFQ